MAISTDITPVALNAQYESLADTWDRIETLPNLDTVNLVNETLSAWQDWFWGEYEIWDTNEIYIWVDRYNKLEPIVLEALAQSRLLPEKPISEPKEPGQVIQLPTEYVYGTVHPIQPAGISKGMLWTIGGLLAAIFLSKAR